jgi:hypothetical protein
MGPIAGMNALARKIYCPCCRSHCTGCLNPAPTATEFQMVYKRSRHSFYYFFNSFLKVSRTTETQTDVKMKHREAHSDSE